MEKDSECVMVLDDDCEETESRVCGTDDDNQCLDDENTTVETVGYNGNQEELKEDWGLDDNKREDNVFVASVNDWKYFEGQEGLHRTKDTINMEIIRLGLKAEQTTLSIHDDESNVRSLEDQSSFVADIKEVKHNHVFNTAGVIVRPGVDECESHKTETIRVIENRIVSVVNCDMCVKEEDEIEESLERIDLGRLVYGDEGMKVNTSKSVDSESVDSEFMVMEVDEFQDCANLMNICLPYTKGKEVVKAKCNSLVENKDEYGVQQNTSKEDNDLILSDLVLGKYCDQRCFEGWADGYKSFYVATYASDVHSSSDKTFTCDDQWYKQEEGTKQVKMKMSDKEAAEKNEDNFGHLEFDICKWPTRKKVEGIRCKVKFRKWKFNIWKWPKKKKNGGIQDDYSLLLRGVTKKEFSIDHLKFDCWKWTTRKKRGGIQCTVELRRGNFDMRKWPRRKKGTRLKYSSVNTKAGSLTIEEFNQKAMDYEKEMHSYEQPSAKDLKIPGRKEVGCQHKSSAVQTGFEFCKNCYMELCGGLDGLKTPAFQWAENERLANDKPSICIFKETHGQDLLGTWSAQDVEGGNKWKGLMVYVVVQWSDGCANKIIWEWWSDSSVLGYMFAVGLFFLTFMWHLDGTLVDREWKCLDLQIAAFEGVWIKKKGCWTDVIGCVLRRLNFQWFQINS